MSVGLHDAERGEFWKIEALSNHLSANDDVDFAIINLAVDFTELLIGVGIGVETSDARFWK